MGEVRVNGAGNKLASNFSELLGLVAVSNNLGWADESEIQRVEEKN